MERRRLGTNGRNGDTGVELETGGAQIGIAERIRQF